MFLVCFLASCGGRDLPATITVDLDAYGRRTRIDDSNLGVHVYTYNGFDENESETDGNGQRITFAELEFVAGTLAPGSAALKP